jgi:hypothetical protein
MLPVTQTDTSRGRGNCLQAAVASLLELPLAEVPHFILWPDWEIRFMDFMADNGLPVTMTAYDKSSTGIAIGPTVRHTTHAVVVNYGRTVWDPHPSRAGLLRIDHVYDVHMR